MKSKVLIVDDEKETRELLKSFLESDDIELYEANNGQEALDMVSEGQFDLYVTDVFMPEMNGIEFLKILKMLDPDAIVIIITGYDNVECTRQALDYGAFRFLTKPLKMADFRNIVESGLIERKKLFHTTTIEKLMRMKEKVNANVKMRVNLFEKMQAFLIAVEKNNPSYIEIGGPGSNEKIWGKFQAQFKPIELKTKFTQDEINIMVLSILSNEQFKKLVEDKDLRFNYEFKYEDTIYRYIFNVYFEMDELVIGIRAIRRELINLERMKLTSSVLNRLTFANGNSGLVIISGAAGTGKSCLADALINLNNSYLSGNIYVITESIEYYHKSKSSVVRHQELNRDVNNVDKALDKCLTYKPNLVVIEEITSSKILDRLMQLADSGCLVIASLRSNSIMEALHNLFSFYSQDNHPQLKKLLARTLSAIICLKLVPAVEEKMYPVKEILVNNEETSSVISTGSIEDLYNVMLRGRKHGMYTLEQNLAYSVKEGVITKETATQAANEIQILRELLR